MLTPTIQCSICDELIRRATVLGREYSKAVSLMWKARHTPHFGALSEAADIAHFKFVRAKSALENHRDGFGHTIDRRDRPRDSASA